MKIDIRKNSDVVIIDIEGNIDINSSALVETVAMVLKDQLKGIVFNFERVNLIDYVGISLMAVIYKNILNHNTKLKIYNLPIQVKKLFAIVGLNRIFQYHSSESQAIGSLDDDKNETPRISEPLRRRFERIPLKALIEFKQQFSPDQIFFQGNIVNLSAEGVFVSTDHFVRTQDLLVVRLSLLPKPGIIEVYARVVWVADQEIQQKDYPGMGLEFFNLCAGEQEKIIYFVEKHFTHSSS